MSSYNLSRSFVLEKQTSLQTQILKGQVTVSEGQASLEHILSQLGDVSEYTFKIYNFTDNKYHKIRDYATDQEDGYTVPAELLRTDIVLIKYVPDASETVSLESGSLSSSDASSTKKQRSKERTIAEVIEIVKQWRDMHLSNNGKKVNLQQAAELVGISKKSLDDYYYQLRLGQKYDFDFKSNLNQKVGALRTFIKQIKPKKRDSRAKMQKHPKKLKIIEQLGEVQLTAYRRKSNSSRSKSDQNQLNNNNNNDEFVFMEDETQKQKQRKQREQNFDEDADKKSLKSLQNQFYNEFEFMGEQPQDPFLNFQADFKKKKDFDEGLGEDYFF